MNGLDAISEACEVALGGRDGAVFTREPEARILAAFGLAHAAARRGGPDAAGAVAMLLGLEPCSPRLARALGGLRVLDPACGAGALLVACEDLAQRAGARLALHGLDVAELAVGAARERLGARAALACADALEAPWPACDLVVANPPFLRHEALPPVQKRRAAAASGLSRQADLCAHFAALALARAPVAALVLPRALEVSRSAAPLFAAARARGGFPFSLRSRAAGSFAASVDTRLCVWREGASDAPPAEARAPLAGLAAGELAALARGVATPRVAFARARALPSGAGRVAGACDVRFGVKSGCNAFFHLEPLGGGRYASELCGEVALEDGDVQPLLATLKEAAAPRVARPRKVLFRPDRPSARALAFVARGEAEGVHRRPTCASRDPWWRLAPGRPPAPVLYPAKIGARAFAFENREGLCEDKKWLALFPRGLPPWLLAAVLSSTPLRLFVEEGARQLTGAQAIADVDCRVLAAAPFPRPAALAPLERDLAAAWEALAPLTVTTGLAAMLARPEQRALDALAGRALGLTAAEVGASRRALVERVEARLAHAATIREALQGA